jgi:hypothetical protein
MIENTANALGADVSAGLKIIVVDVARRLTDQEIAVALERCRLEIRSVNGFPPRITSADILEKGGIVFGRQAEDLEATKAWDFIANIAENHLRREDGEVILCRKVVRNLEHCDKCNDQRVVAGTDTKGRTIAETCTCLDMTPIPAIPERIAKTVQRLGGWSTFYVIAPKNFPFVRRDFISEYIRAGQLETVTPICIESKSRHRGELGPASDGLSGIRKELAAESSVA